ncbi:receptor activity-modifying protein 2 isoform X1 [Protopterus annectens]|uniref:receptor activity-modifying protein 2 isoform X1 n=1 Tax=Protopterus annectens TaxID=7888 RepID=UPI001CFC2BB3|nr:receptor activity-modifying protein 2 isoform X1 [Protopterus annectens]
MNKAMFHISRLAAQTNQSVPKICLDEVVILHNYTKQCNYYWAVTQTVSSHDFEPAATKYSVATSCKGFYGKADRISNLPAGLRDNTSCYAEIIEVVCWAHFNSTMNTRFKNESYCDWSQVMRVYSEFQNCTEYVSEFYCLPYPNPLVEDFFFQAHRTFFSKCNSPPPPPLVMDPPISTLLGMIAIPICLLPFMVLLVVWKTKDGEPQL